MLGIVTLFILKTLYTPNSLEVSEIKKKNGLGNKINLFLLEVHKAHIKSGVK